MTELERVKRALSLTVALLFPREPGDSRAVSNEFVALAMVDCGIGNTDSDKIIEDSLAALVAAGPAHSPAPPTLTVEYS